jgi:methylmalonyl-CoA mutase N-terminal domain/subunit
MAAVFGGAQSIFTCAMDEAFQIPTEFSAELAVRTQQIIAFESGIARSVDPLGGSYVLEQYTDKMEETILGIMGEIDEYGGVNTPLNALVSGFNSASTLNLTTPGPSFENLYIYRSKRDG